MLDVQIKAILPNCKTPSVWAQLINTYGLPVLSTPLRLAHFLAQTGHESSHFNVLVENLNYSKEGLLKTFPKYFNDQTATQYARQPEKIASRVYANRLGNGNEQSMDGWTYRGRGLIQITGKNNYIKVLAELGTNDPKFLETPEGAVRSAIWFWTTNKINGLADQDDVNRVTRVVNGGTHGLDDRIAILKRAKIILGC